MCITTSLSFYLETYGCQMNDSDSNIIRASLTENGFSEVYDPTKASVIILNTCTVRQSAEQRIYGRIGHLKPIRKKNNSIVVLTGCMAQHVEHDIPDVDIIVGTHHKTQLASIILDYAHRKNKHAYTSFNNYKFALAKPQKNEPFKANVNIIHGCNNTCSFCIVPYTRGIEISRPLSEIIVNVKQLVDAGVVEIMLLGQNVLAYGRDINGASFGELLEQIDKIDGLKRIRFLSPHPKDFNKRFIKTLSQLNSICRHFHIPIQSASDRILKSMERKYTFAEYMDIINTIRVLMPDSSISTDIIVGFPGETEVDFNETYNAIKTIRFNYAYMFKYNPRSFTKAINFPDQLDNQEKLSRLDKIIQLQRGITKEIHQTLVGQVEEVLFERPSKKKCDEILGKTKTNLPVVVPGDTSLIGKIKDIKLVRLLGNTFQGEIVELSEPRLSEL